VRSKLEASAVMFFAEGLVLQQEKYFGKLWPSNVLDFHFIDLPLEGYIYMISRVLKVDPNRFHMRCFEQMCQKEKWLTERGLISQVSVEYLRELCPSPYSDKIASDKIKIVDVIRNIIFEMHGDLENACYFMAGAKRPSVTLSHAQLLRELMICTYRDLENCEKLDVTYLNNQIDERISMIRKGIVADGKCYFTGRVTRVCNLAHCLCYLLKESVCADCTGFLACYCMKETPRSN
jgi:hypothetical protein